MHLKTVKVKAYINIMFYNIRRGLVFPYNRNKLERTQKLTN